MAKKRSRFEQALSCVRLCCAVFFSFKFRKETCSKYSWLVEYRRSLSGAFRFLPHFRPLGERVGGNTQHSFSLPNIDVKFPTFVCTSQPWISLPNISFLLPNPLFSLPKLYVHFPTFIFTSQRSLSLPNYGFHFPTLDFTTCPKLDNHAETAGCCREDNKSDRQWSIFLTHHAKGAQSM